MWFQELIGILLWSVEIGRVDILTQLSLLSAYQASPREGHLNQFTENICIFEEETKAITMPLLPLSQLLHK
jgi:hypothetical protein